MSIDTSEVHWVKSHFPNYPPIILASGSPRRKDLLTSIGLQFDVILPTVDEKAFDISGLNPAEQVMALAEFKGQSVAQNRPDQVVIAADTIVVIDNQVLEKPVDIEDAFRMLNLLQGREHSVYSAIAVFYQGQKQVEVLETKVTMRSLSSEKIRQYIATGEPMDKAGAYAIQGFGSVLISKIDGCYFNVVGMSLNLLDQLSAALGVHLIFQQN